MKKPKNYEDLPQRSPIKPPNTWKEYDHRRWNVVRRVISSFVGQSWDKAYSHICHKFDWIKNDPDALKYLVKKNCSLINGVYYGSDGEELTYFRFCVVNGILHKQKRIKFRRVKKESPVKLINGKHYIEIDEIWYRLELADYKTAQWCGRNQYYDCVFGSCDDLFLYRIYGGLFVAVKKKQIGKKEKREIDRIQQR